MWPLLEDFWSYYRTSKHIARSSIQSRYTSSPSPASSRLSMIHLWKPNYHSLFLSTSQLSPSSESSSLQNLWLPLFMVTHLIFSHHSQEGEWMILPFYLLSYLILFLVLFWRYLKPSVMQKATNGMQLMEVINNSKEDDYRSPPDLGISAKMELDNLHKTQDTRHVQLKLNFHAACRVYLETMCKKIVERSPIKYPIIRQVCFSLSLWRCIYMYNIS